MLVFQRIKKDTRNVRVSKESFLGLRIEKRPLNKKWPTAPEVLCESSQGMLRAQALSRPQLARQMTLVCCVKLFRGLGASADDRGQSSGEVLEPPEFRGIARRPTFICVVSAALPVSVMAGWALESCAFPLPAHGIGLSAGSHNILHIFLV